MMKPSPIVPGLEKKVELTQPVNIKTIIERNPFDPDRGTPRTAGAEASPIATQKIKGVALVGTVLLGDSRYAIVEQALSSTWAGRGGHVGQSGQRRLQVGDALEGFMLSEIDVERVLFTNGTSRIEIPLDFSRSKETHARAQMPPVPPTAAVPGVPPAPSTSLIPVTAPLARPPVAPAMKPVRTRPPAPGEKP